MFKIKRLTPEQEAIKPIIRDEWLRIALSTEPMNRERAEAAIRLAYRCASLEQPAVIIWLKSPLAGALLVTFLESMGPLLRDRSAAIQADLRDSIEEGVHATVEASMWDYIAAGVLKDVHATVQASMWAGVENGVPDAIVAGVWKDVHTAVAAAVGADVWKDVDETLQPPNVQANIQDSVKAAIQADANVSPWFQNVIFGQHVASWVSFYAYFAAIGLDCVSPMNGLFATARECGWWWPYKTFAVATERPVELHHDSRFHLHCQTGPAIRYSDGWAIWALHGRRVPQQLVEAPETITIAQIDDEANSDVKSLMLAAFGYERYLTETGAQFKQRDDWGTLWEIPRKGMNPVMLLEWVNGTPHPDGTHQRGFIRVNSTCATAREAEHSIRHLSEFRVNRYEPTRIT